MRGVLAEDGVLADPEFYGEYREAYSFPVTEEWESTYLRMTSWATEEEGEPSWSRIGLSFWGEIVSWLDSVGRGDVKMAVREAFMEDLSGDLGIPDWTQCLFDWGHPLNRQPEGQRLTKWVDWVLYENENGLALDDHTGVLDSPCFSDGLVKFNLDVCLPVAETEGSMKPSRLHQPGASVVLGTCWCRIDSLLAHLNGEAGERYSFRPLIESVSGQMNLNELREMRLSPLGPKCENCRHRDFVEAFGD